MHARITILLGLGPFLTYYTPAPDGASVNDGIPKETCSLFYISVDTMVDRVLAFGQGALLAKLDVKQAYRMVPVHPQDGQLLGMRWAKYL